MIKTDLHSIATQLENIDPVKYGMSRNYEDGAVTKLSPYISRGVLSCKQVYEAVKGRGISFERVEKFVQELCWREYWQYKWQIFPEYIAHVSNNAIPRGLAEANTGIEAVDNSLHELESTGYMHNHMRMYVASIACVFGRYNWNAPARWMYYHLLDGDWGSNAFSWQWVSGVGRPKFYFANQENINKYFHSDQKGTFLDRPYEDFTFDTVPTELVESTDFVGTTELPTSDEFEFHSNRPVLVYNYYNLDPNWRVNEEVDRVLLLEPSFFNKYPVSKKCIDFIVALAKNIEGIKILVMEFDELKLSLKGRSVIYKEHPTTTHYSGFQDSRDWLVDYKGKLGSFFSFWKKVKPQIEW